MSEAKHTPWRHTQNKDSGRHLLISADGRCIATFWNTDAAENCGHAIRVVNSHDEMLAALKDTQDALRELGPDGWSEAPHLLNVISAAIAKAEGRS